MFGNNPIRPVLRDADHLAVEEIFYTLQGEGPYSGMPALFIRMAGCNLACHFCDTQFESKADLPQDLAGLTQRIQDEYSVQQRQLVVLTGGEPMRQNCSKLIQWLLHTGTKLIQVETAGTAWQPDMADFSQDDQVIYVCSPKTPQVRAEIAARCWHWKYVVRGGEVDPTDGLPNRSTQLRSVNREQRIFRPPHWQKDATVWISPCDEQDRVLNKVNQDLARDLCLQYGYRLNLQIHKIVNVR